jgi:hypothetical protein
VKVNAGIGGGFSATAGVSSSLSASAGISASLQSGVSAGASASFTPPAFKFGASGSLGTGIEGAFGTGSASAGLTAGSIANGSLLLRSEGSVSSLSPLKAKSQLSTNQAGSGKIKFSAKGSVGFD